MWAWALAWPSWAAEAARSGQAGLAGPIGPRPNGSGRGLGPLGLGAVVWAWALWALALWAWAAQAWALLAWSPWGLDTCGPGGWPRRAREAYLGSLCLGPLGLGAGGHGSGLGWDSFFQLN